MAKKTEPKAEKKKKKPAVTGFAPLKHGAFTIKQKRTGRFEVLDAKGKNVNGADKVKILLEAKIHKPSEKKPAAPAAEETPAT